MEHSATRSGCNHPTPRQATNNRPPSHPVSYSGADEPCNGYCCKARQCPEHMLACGPSSSFQGASLNQLASQGPTLAQGGGPLSLLGGQHPAAINLNLAADPPEDAGALSKNLQELAQLWQDWHGLGLRQLPAEQATAELKRLTSLTIGAAGAASQGALNRQQAADLLSYSAGVLEDHGQAADAEYVTALSDKLAAVPNRGGGVLFQNIQRGLSQSASLSGGTQTAVAKPSIRAALAAKSDADVRARSEARALACIRAWVESRGCGLLGLAAAGAAALLGAEVLKYGMCGTLGALGSGARRQLSTAGRGKEERRRRRLHEEAAEVRRVQCERANARARKYIRELRDNRANPLWHDDPPMDTCPMPANDIPWRPNPELMLW